MKKIILLVSVVLFGCVGYAQAQTSEKKLSRQERKEAKRAMEQALFEEAKQAIENKSFTLEADQVIFKRGRTAFVSSNTNFVTVNGNTGSFQYTCKRSQWLGWSNCRRQCVRLQSDHRQKRQHPSGNEYHRCRYFCPSQYFTGQWRQQCNSGYSSQFSFQQTYLIRHSVAIG